MEKNVAVWQCPRVTAINVQRTNSPPAAIQPFASLVFCFDKRREWGFLSSQALFSLPNSTALWLKYCIEMERWGTFWLLWKALLLLLCPCCVYINSASLLCFHGGWNTHRQWAQHATPPWKCAVRRFIKAPA